MVARGALFPNPVVPKENNGEAVYRAQASVFPATLAALFHIMPAYTIKTGALASRKRGLPQNTSAVISPVAMVRWSTNHGAVQHSRPRMQRTAASTNSTRNGTYPTILSRTYLRLAELT